MTLRIYNTLTGKKETFEPLVPGHVRMYVCGPTVYDYCHIGHARSAVVFDVIARYLRSLYKVTYVRNFTDVDDKIIARANEKGESAKALAQHFIEAFQADMQLLHVTPADREPRVTEHIEAIVALVEHLIAAGHAYASNGSVYFDVTSYSEYGKLSGRRLENMEAGARVQVDANKRNPHDFALWKAVKPNEPFWESPWGPGRPGWHIECSAMSRDMLGASFDIHGGGKDLIFPHHENEIAQSECATGHPYARFWIHNGFVNINQEKMSKSLGNFKTIREVIKEHHPEAVRLFLLSSQYRSPIDFSLAAMQEAGTRLERLYTLVDRLERETDGLPAEPQATAPDRNQWWQKFQAALDDDFNSALAIAVLFELVRHTHSMLDELTGKPAEHPLRVEVRENAMAMRSMGEILGILNSEPVDFFSMKDRDGATENEVDTQTIQTLIDQRIAARKAKNWALADEIRDELAGYNVTLEDRPDGTIWKITR